VPNSGINGEWFATTPEYWARVIAASGPIIGWQLWYEDGLWCASDLTPWHGAPRRGVQVLVTHHPGGLRNLTTGRDEYTLPGESKSKLGLEIYELSFNEIVADALRDTWRP
jgi:hypothetical protein